MDANAPGRRRRLRLPTGGLAVVGAVVVLVAVVAIASSGSVPSDDVAQRRPSDGVLDTLISLVLVVMAVSAVVSVVLLSFVGRNVGDTAAPARGGWVRNLVVLVVAIGLLALIARGQMARDGDGPQIVQPDPGGVGDPDQLPNQGYEPEFAVWPVVGVTVLALIALAAWWLSYRGRRAIQDDPPTPAEALADVLDATLDDLRAEADPRRAVIRAYARMERSLAAVGLPRGEAEAPEEYLGRVLGELPVSAPAAARLTKLFAWARFSSHDVRPEMKEEAIETLEQVQRELAAAETEREARLEGVLA
jgi:Domain of unknown function (DUF4129)